MVNVPAGDEALVGQEELRDLLFGDLPDLAGGERETMFARTFDPETPDPDVPMPTDDTWDLFPASGDDGPGDTDDLDDPGNPYDTVNGQHQPPDLFEDQAAPADADDPDGSDQPGPDEDGSDDGYEDVAGGGLSDTGDDASDPFSAEPSFDHQPDPSHEPHHGDDPW